MTAQSLLALFGLWLLIAAAYVAALIASKVTSRDAWLAAAIILGAVGVTGALMALP